jgi:hypothetical protein
VVAGALLIATFVFSEKRTLATGGVHVDSETPGSREAVIFSPIGRKSNEIKVAIDRVRKSASEHNYLVTAYTDDTEARELPVTDTDDDPGRATARNFLRLSEKGLVFINTHTVRDRGLLVEGYGTEEARRKALERYQKPGQPFSQATWSPVTTKTTRRTWPSVSV